MTEEKARAMADVFVDGLLTNGSGEGAYRLVLTSKDGRDLGGWGRKALVDKVAALILRATKSDRRETELQERGRL